MHCLRKPLILKLIYRSPFPWFYFIFFMVMIAHRTSRDIARCRRKYGKAWDEYERRVPYLFIPVSWPIPLAIASPI